MEPVYAITTELMLFLTTARHQAKGSYEALLIFHDNCQLACYCSQALRTFSVNIHCFSYHTLYHGLSLPPNVALSMLDLRCMIL